MKSIAYVGMDVHKDSIVCAILPTGSVEPTVERKIMNDKIALKKWVSRWEKLYDLRCCYEASSCGYVVHRWLLEMGVSCEVIAPSLIPTRPGEKIKTDPKDARKLARLYRAGELVSVHVPSEEDESVRRLVRCRETIQKEALSSKHYVLKFLSVKGLTYKGKTNWTKEHWKYLRSIKLTGPDETVYRNYLTLLEYKLEQLHLLDKEIEVVAWSEKYKEVVGRLICLRGVGILTAMVVISEVQDFARFKSPRQITSYFGIVPGEKSSGGTRKLGGITKTGNSRVRRVLLESAWHYQHKPAMTEALKKRQEGQSLEVITHSWKAQQRLHKKFWGIANRKERCKAAIAVARELAGFMWALVTQYDNVGLKAA
jgi:transposase